MRQTVGLRVLSWVGVVGRPTSCDADAVISQRWFRISIPKQEAASRKIPAHRPLRTCPLQEFGRKTSRDATSSAQRGKRLRAYIYRNVPIDSCAGLKGALRARTSGSVALWSGLPVNPLSMEPCWTLARFLALSFPLHAVCRSPFLFVQFQYVKMSRLTNGHNMLTH